MHKSTKPLQPLADFLDDKFADIHAGEWTKEIRATVKNYLLHKTEPELYPWLSKTYFDLIGHIAETGLTEEQADAIIASNMVGGIAYSLHEAAILATPTLGELIERTDNWYTGEQREAIKIWLVEHVSPGKFMLIAQRTMPSLAMEQDDLYRKGAYHTLTEEVPLGRLLNELQELETRLGPDY